MKILRRLLVNSAMATLIFLAIMYTLLEGNFTELNINNSLFVTGMVLFFVGVLTATQAAKIFRGFGFAFKKFFSRTRSDMSYYEYITEKERMEATEDRPTGWYAIIVGIAAILVSILFF